MCVGVTVCMDACMCVQKYVYRWYVIGNYSTAKEVRADQCTMSRLDKLDRQSFNMSLLSTMMLIGIICVRIIYHYN